MVLITTMEQICGRDPRGRKSKGVRDRHAVLPPVTFGAILRLDAAQQGLTVADHLLRVVKDAYGLDSFSPDALTQLMAELGLQQAEVDAEVARVMKTSTPQQRHGSTAHQEELPISTAA
ncbi:hypothetical protein C5C45_13580 [Rathayibacter rathayi]|uniref:Uncharacterized protein n=1 Tax=Rathayibacter rathayi TaxID=33887 RepID=A0ABX5AC62_RATRA|nr:hypothetical protein C5C34_10205 [Rathayibacter rathayi]PPF44737.1 hypothetical protein C5C08_12940 [Rathayibacter rathayi]PPH63977.1 hypothetical protein C5C45_13580 [Rathayibacter rathayi]PPH74229.1 hypothetical protein C5C40_13225 [Rathayibacter rathayi]PPI07003.1 hypothetical protein C5D23_12570 [Rathayibacter rathayi]